MIQTVEEIKVTKWKAPERTRHEFQAAATPDEDGGFAIFALHYPGVISDGDTLDEAVHNIADAFLLMLESRQHHGESMMFSDAPVEQPASNSQVIRVVVDG